MRHENWESKGAGTGRIGICGMVVHNCKKFNIVN